MHYDAIIIGAGAAGLYCALHAGKRGRRVLVLEHNSEVGAKILISGGGRCNFTNRDGADPARYLCANPHFARSALTRHPPREFIALIERHRIAHYEKTLGQLFCEGARAAHKIVRMLLDECTAGGVAIRTACEITEVRRAERFVVETNQGAFESEALVIATGGLSIPKLGASGFAFDVAGKFGVPLIAPRPGLVPLTFAAADLAWMRPLAGVSAEIIARAGNAVFREAALFTHRGLSGPAILQISSYWREGEALVIDWLPGAPDNALVASKRDRPRAQLRTVLAEMLPARLAEAFVQHGAPAPPPASAAHAGEAPAVQNGVLGDMKDAALIQIARALKHWPLTPIGTEGYAKAEVMVGGVDTDALSQQTMACRTVPGLYFIGEAVDVTGWLGGYNFQWAWSSGWAAGQAV